MHVDIVIGGPNFLVLQSIKGCDDIVGLPIFILPDGSVQARKRGKKGLIRCGTVIGKHKDTIITKSGDHTITYKKG
jgi:hypothetical protein